MTQVLELPEKKPPTYITPDLPPDALQAIEDWRQPNSPRTTLIKVVERNERAACDNCQDHKSVYIQFCSFGPSMSVPRTSPKTNLVYADSDPRREGWYIVERLVAFKCGHCR